MNRRSVRPVSSLVSRMSALPSGDSAMPASTHGVPASASSAAVRRCICTRMRRTRASFSCSGVGAAPPPGPGPSPGPRIMICMPPPMPPRFCVSSHAVVPFSTDVRSIVGPPTMPPICISSTRFILSGRAIVTVSVPSMSRPPIERRNGPSAVRPLRPATLSSPPSALRAAETMPATRSCAASGEIRNAIELNE